MNTQKYNADYWKQNRARLLIKKALRYRNDLLYQMRIRARAKKQSKEKALLRKIMKGVGGEDEG